MTFIDPSRKLRRHRDTSLLLTGWAKDAASSLNVCFDAEVAVC